MILRMINGGKMDKKLKAIKVTQDMKEEFNKDTEILKKIQLKF
jgi:hypothetical protein